MLDATQTGESEPTLPNPYSRAVDREPVLVPQAELALAEEIRALKKQYWATLLSLPEVAPTVAHAARADLGAAAARVPCLNGGRGANYAVIAEALMELDVACDIADSIAADLADHGDNRLHIDAPTRRSSAFSAYLGRKRAAVPL